MGSSFKLYVIPMVSCKILANRAQIILHTCDMQ